MSQNTHQQVLYYIENYWDLASSNKLKPCERNRLMRIGQIKLPHPCASPNHNYFAGTQFYWDTYFTVLGLIESGRLNLAKGMVDNLCFLYEKFGLVPARNSWTSVGRTQPPFLTRIGNEVYEAKGADEKWLDKLMSVAKREYNQVWTSGQRLEKSSGLSLYRPKYFRGYLTTYESGWDKSSRFVGRQVLPVDLNCLLHLYEQDFANYYTIVNKAQAKAWRKKAESRLEAINRYFWDENSGFFYDFDLNANKHSTLMTLAGFFPLWCGIANQAQAASCREKLSKFEHAYGLANTENLAWKGRQWDYPNGWPNLQLIVIQGLKRYGFDRDAKRLAGKWLKLNRKVFNETGQLWEKYDVVNGKIGQSGGYPTQPGFAWTNAIYMTLTDIVDLPKQ